jgi:hypothetical protein
VTIDLDTLLRDADPLRRPIPGAPDDQVLETARRRIDRVRAALPGPRPAAPSQPVWRTRVALVAAAAAVLTAVPLVLSAVLPEDSGIPGVVPAAVASDGTLDCGRGFADPIGPDEADVRLLPDHVPAGWSLDTVFARSTTTTGWCLPPSLAALRVGADDVVTGRLSVVGPIEATIDDDTAGASTPDTVDGHPARMFSFDDGQPFQRWFWTDDGGRQWVAEATGLPLQEARTVLAAASTTGSGVSWDTAAAPGWTLVHQRTGAPYGTTRTSLEWYVRFIDAGEERLLEVGHAQDAIPLLSYADVGSRLLTLDGHQALRHPATDSEDADGNGATDGPVTPLDIEIGPGTVASFWAAGDLPTVEDLLTSLRSVPADDPRLREHWTE